jgi:UDP-3-O-[3-hydroxymyristoyl] glucosamine N-acyltransferase
VAARSLAELAALLGGEPSGSPELRVTGVATLEEAGPEQVSFFSNRRYRAAFLASRAGAVVVGKGEAVPEGRVVVRAANPYLAFAKLSTLFNPPPVAVAGVSPQAVVDATARVDATAQVMALASVGPGAEIGPRTVLHPGVRVGAGARVGADCLLHPNAVVRERCVLGDRVILQPGCVIGGDGFGYALDMEGEGRGPRHFKIPQAGIVVLEDDVEIGANACVDRAALGVTRIGRGSKIDNLVQVGHNVEIGPLCIMAGQAGIAGSSRLGMGVVVWGQAAIGGHLTVGDRVNIAAQSGVAADVPAGERVAGLPAVDEKLWARNQVAATRLAELRREFRVLQREVARLAASRDAPGDKEKP